MAYGVYNRKKGQTTFARCGEIVKNRKGFLTHKDFRFETLEQAECYAKKLEIKYNQETKIKIVK